MYAGEMLSLFGKIEKLQKGDKYATESDATNGVWIIYDPDRQCIVMLGMTEHTLYWEKAFSVLPDIHKELFEQLQADLVRPDNERCFPCKVLRDDLAWLCTKLKSYKNGLLYLQNFVRDKDKVTLTFSVGYSDKPFELPALAQADNPSSVEGMLYKEMVRHGGRWADKYAPMEVGGWKCNTYPTGMRMCMELMASRDKKKNEEAISLIMYGMYGEDKGEDGTPPHKYIEQNHWEMRDANVETPERGVIHMVVRQPEDKRKHYIS